MNYLARMRTAGLSITWRTLAIGLESRGGRAPLLTIDDVTAHAERRLSEVDVSDDAVQIAVVSDDPTAVRATLRQLVSHEGSDEREELRKRRLILLMQQLDDLPDDPGDGLLALSVFWAEFDWPADSPHAYQSPGTDPGMYYSDENFHALVQRHRDWIQSEAAALRARELLAASNKVK